MTETNVSTPTANSLLSKYGSMVATMVIPALLRLLSRLSMADLMLSASDEFVPPSSRKRPFEPQLPVSSTSNELSNMSLSLNLRVKPNVSLRRLAASLTGNTTSRLPLNLNAPVAYRA